MWNRGIMESSRGKVANSLARCVSRDRFQLLILLSSDSFNFYSMQGTLGHWGPG